jgi:hypothetical protein
MRLKKEPAPGDGPERVSRYALRPPVSIRVRGLSDDKVNLRLIGPALTQKWPLVRISQERSPGRDDRGFPRV